MPSYLDPNLGVSTFVSPTARKKAADLAAKQAEKDAKAKAEAGTLAKMTEQLFANKKAAEGDKVHGVLREAARTHTHIVAETHRSAPPRSPPPPVTTPVSPTTNHRGVHLLLAPASTCVHRCLFHRPLPPRASTASCLCRPCVRPRIQVVSAWEAEVLAPKEVFVESRPGDGSYRPLGILASMMEAVSRKGLLLLAV